MTVLNPNLCYKEVCYKGTAVTALFFFIIQLEFEQLQDLTKSLGRIMRFKMGEISGNVYPFNKGKISYNKILI